MEGEKCADALTKLGCLATTSPGGSNGVNKADWNPLSGKKVIIWPDKDKAGKIYGANVLSKLNKIEGSNQTIKTVDIDKIELEEKGDAFDWIEKGFGKEDILNIPVMDINNMSDLGVITIDQGEIWRVVDQTEKLLMKANPCAIFQQDNRLIRIVETPINRMNSNGEHSIGLVNVSAGYLQDLFNRSIIYLQPNSDGSLKAIDPPAKIANRYLARSGNWNVNSLSGLIYAPTLRPDGSVLELPGYDEKTGIFYARTGTRFKPLKKDLNKKDALKALKKLSRPFQDFPFTSPEDKSVFLAAILTSLVRPSIKTAPLYGFSAPTAGSGKTLLANIVSVIATGKQAVVASQGKNNEEERKHLFAKLLQGKPVLVIDNIQRPLSSDVLCAILTAPGETYSDRILGRSEVVEVPTNVTILATGNNLTFQGDLTRRALLCTIDPKCESPEARKDFKINNLVEYVYENRSKLVISGLTILKAYILAGKPKQKIPQYGSFEEWSDLVRSALVWLDCADPNLTKKKIEQEDPTKMNFNRILSLWKSIYDDKAVTVAEIVTDLNREIEDGKSTSEKYELSQIFREVTWTRGKLLSGESIGKWLRSNKDKIHNGHKIIKDPSSPKSRVIWVLKQVL